MLLEKELLPQIDLEEVIKQFHMVWSSASCSKEVKNLFRTANPLQDQTVQLS